MHPHFYYIALSLIPGMGSVNTKQLIAYCGSAEEVFKQKKGHLLKIPGIGVKTVQSIVNSKVFDLAQKELEFCEKHKINIIPYASKEFPSRLSHCQDCPVILYKKGSLDLNPQKSLAIVGTRKASKMGRDFVKRFIEEISFLDLQIVSGMALGIDACAHRFSLDYDVDTVGVLAHPLNTMYPAVHRKMAREMLEEGNALISEYPSSAEIVPANFPMRNRIVAGMCDATLVVESAEKGGALITAYIANSYNRDVFAVPGRTKDKYSAGCNKLIKHLKANLVENAQDLIEQMAWADVSSSPKRIQRSLALDLNPEESKIVNALKEEESMETDRLASIIGLSPGKLANILLELELKGVVYVLPGNRIALN